MPRVLGRMGPERLRPTLRCLVNSSQISPLYQFRSLHKTRPRHKIPEPCPFVPDVKTFLTLIGRGMNRYSPKFPTWDSLFALTSPELKELGVEPPRSRKYLLQWMQKYREGDLGPGGDFRYVSNGQALLKVATPPLDTVTDAKWVVNVPQKFTVEATPDSGESTGTQSKSEGSILMDSLAADSRVFQVKKYTVRGLRTISGPGAIPLLHNNGVIVKMTEGMWEQKQGRKIDGGERRQAEVRFKRRSAERRAEREAEQTAKV